MKILTVSALVCAVMALTTAAVVPAVMDENNQTANHLTESYEGWTLINGRFFRYVPKLMTWADAEKHCQTMEANLASIHNILEYRAIQRLIMDVSFESERAWVGGSDAEQENEWFWSDGTPFVYLNWCKGEPNNGKGRQHCLAINYSADKCWDDMECDLQLPSVCAMKV